MGFIMSDYVNIAYAGSSFSTNLTKSEAFILKAWVNLKRIDIVANLYNEQKLSIVLLP